MPNIFNGMAKLSDEEIINQIAVLETINRVNVSKPMFQKALKKAVNIINYVGNKFGKDTNVKEPNVKEIWTMIEEAKEELRGNTREQLKDRMREILIDKCKMKTQIPSDDELSIAVIEECCKLFGISPKMMPCVKADLIYKKSENYISYENDNEDMDKNEYTKESSAVIDGQNISFLKLGKKYDRELLVNFVCMCIKGYGKKFSPNKQDMPSFVGQKEQEKINEKEKAIEVLRNEIRELKNIINEKIKDSSNNENTIKSEKRLLNNLNNIKDNAESDIRNLNRSKESLLKEKEKYESKIQILEEERVNASLDKLDEVMKVYEEVKLRIFDINTNINSIDHEVVYNNNLINNCNEDIERKEKNIELICQSKEKTDNELKEVNELYSEKKEILNCVENKKRESILIKWIEFYHKFTFNENDLKNIVNYDNNQLLSIEQCLYELNNTENPMALSNGIIKDGADKYDYIEIIDEDGFRFEVWYEVFENANKNIHIREIYS